MRPSARRLDAGRPWLPPSPLSVLAICLPTGGSCLAEEAICLPTHLLPACLPASQAKLAKMGFMLQQRPVPLDNIYTAAQAQVAYLVRAAPHQTPAHPNPNPSQALGPRARPRH